MSEIKLLQCPFCGGEARTYFLNGAWLVECNNSKCIGAKISCGYRSKEEATEAWNTRKPIDDMVERLEKELELADEEKRRCVVENPLQFDSAKGYATGISNALEIVRNGRRE